MVVPEIRCRQGNRRPLRPEGEYVLYWMIAARRTRWNFALQRAVEWAEQLQRPLLVFEPLCCDYPFAGDRLHRFIIEGMAQNGVALARGPALYYPFIELVPDAGQALLAAFADKACVVVTDDFPTSYFSEMVTAAGRRTSVRLEVIDGNGLLPLRAAERDYPTAYAFRRFLQQELRGHLTAFPAVDPLRKACFPPLNEIPKAIAQRWPPAPANLQQACRSALAELPIDHQIAPVPIAGGSVNAGKVLRRFLAKRLDDYAELRNEPDREGTSGLSPYLHFGHISSHEVVYELLHREGWSIGDLSPENRGKRNGWWGMSRSAEAFLDQLVTWRELGFNMCARRTDADRYESLPDWAKETLGKHADDPRPYLYDLADFAAARTHDPLWNAAQRQLLREGTIHGYLRMLWGKKILEWTRHPQQALEFMLELNDRYALDGRDPNSLSGIFWCLGRYDRAWGPERPIFGKIRYMSSQNTARKVRIKGYLERFGDESASHRPTFRPDDGDPGNRAGSG